MSGGVSPNGDRATHEPSPDGLGHAVSVPNARSELNHLIERLRKVRGGPSEWLAMESELLKFLAAVERPARALGIGEVRNAKGHYPAVLVYNPIYKQTLAWAPSGRKMAMEGHHEAAFYSAVPHEAIAREVLSGPETTAIAMEAREGRDAKQGSVEDDSASSEGGSPNA